MPRILPEEQNLYGDGSSSEVSSSEESFQIISEATYSSTKYGSRARESQRRETSQQTQPETSRSTSSNVIEIFNASRSNGVSNGKKRRRDGDIDETHTSKRTRHVDTCQWCQLESFKDFKKYPITITNDAGDDVPLPKDFKFIQKSIYREGVKPADDAFKTGCECSTRGDCELKECTCTEDVEKVPGTKVAAHRMQYTTPPGLRDCLKDAFLDQRQPIYECNEKCACGPSCRNRVVEKGRIIPLEIFRTNDGRGWGLRCTEDLSKGQFIDLYIGEVITAEEADHRRKESTNAKKKDVYLFALDKFTDPESYDERLRGPSLEVDGEFYAGPTRFMNHSCNPNTRIFARVGDHSDKHLHDLAFFAIKNIPRNTELTFDYVDGVDEEPDENEEGEIQECLCRSKNCRGWVW